MGYCLPLTDKANNWSFCPSIAPAYLFAILFGLTTCFHIYQAIITRKAYSTVIILSALAQTATFIFRILSILHPTTSWAYVAWFILILVAPLLTNAFVYMIMGRMVYNFLPEKKLLGIKAWRFGMLFVLLDIIAFLIQVYGAGSASGTDVPVDQMLRGIHIYMGGVGFQEVFILVFVFIAVRFQRKLSALPREHDIYGDGDANKQRAQAFRLLYVLYAVLALITVRIIFRLIEYAQGVNSSIPNHEAFMYCFDTVPMLIAIVLFNVVHPGAVMPGKESDFPSRKARKAAKKEVKMAKKMGKTSPEFELLPTAYDPHSISRLGTPESR